jgi:N6-L-threonylcarbamoyladenine synthase
VDRLAREGDPTAFEFARPMLNQPNDDFSFSGLKTSVRYFLEQHPELAADNARLPDFCASAQAAIVEVLVKKTLRAAKRERIKCLTLSGGVACNSELRKQLQSICDENNFTLRLASPDLCTDNAAMIGLLGEKIYEEGGEPVLLGADIKPGMALN